MTFPPLSIYGTVWHRGKGAKNRMQSHAACTGATCQLQLQDPDSGMRHFGCYATWDEALARLAALRGNKRHLFEVIPHGRPCKPYLDLDAPALPAKFPDVDALVAHADRLLVAIFAADHQVGDIKKRHRRFCRPL